MKVCMILEGCYPYVYGGVSSWTHQYIKAMSEVEFSLWCIGAKSEERGKFKFELPDNVVEVHEVFLDDALKIKGRRNADHALKKQDVEELTKLLGNSEDIRWEKIFELFHDKKVNPVAVLMSHTFLKELINMSKIKYPYVPFADLFHTVRSMILPCLYLFTKDIPEADIYHATATGYSGLLGSMAKWKTHKPFVVTEHGIYTREREEELLRAKWVEPQFKQQWIDLFYSYSSCAYSHADAITSLFEHASEIQTELGARKEKLWVLPNGINYAAFSKIPDKKPDGFIDIGAVVRIAKIKDIKTLIYAFAELKASYPKARLHIMGDVDDEEYFEECKSLVEQLHIRDLIFTGVVKVTEYLEKIDFTVLSSISEGQPLSVLESFAAARPCVTTDVGCCRELIEGNGRDLLGRAGFCVSPMQKDALARAMYQLCIDDEKRISMGKTGQERAKQFYTHEISMNGYRRLYESLEMR